MGKAGRRSSAALSLTALTDLIAGLLGAWTVARHSAPFVIIPLIVSILVRWTARATSLRLDEAGLHFAGLGGRWSVRWGAVRSVVRRTPWEGSAPGGYAAGVRIVLADGRTRDIPDYLDAGRADLAALIEEAQRRAG